MMVALSGLSAFGQGFFTFTSGGGFIWNDYTGPGPYRANNTGPVNWAIMLNTGTPSGTPLVATTTGMSSTATNSFGTQAGPLAWNAILNDPNWHLAINNNTAATVIGTTTTVGGMTGPAANVTDIPVTGTSVNGGTINAFAIAWDATYATPQLAAAANGGNGAAVGWSGVLAYQYQNSSLLPVAWGTQWGSANTAGAFGVIPTVVPEPASFALAGLGMAAMLIAHRRK